MTEHAKSNAQSFGANKKKSGILTWIVIIGISICQGVVTSSDDLFAYVYKDDYKIPASTATTISSLVGIPWSLKPFWGAITDSLPIFGYRRKSYILLTSIIVFLGFFSYLTTLPPVWLGVASVFVINVGQSFMSVLGQAIIVENAQVNENGEQATEEEKEKATSKAVTVYINGRNFGLVVFSAILAIWLTEDNYKTIIKFIAFTPVFVLILSFLLKEKRIKKNKPDALMQDARPEDKDKLKKFFNYIKHPLIIKCWMFIFFASFHVSSGSAGFYYYTNYLKFKPDTVSTVNTISLAATIAAISSYYYFFKDVPLRKFYTVTFFFVMGANLSLLILYFRLNVKWGISDFVLVVLETFVKAIVAELNSVPIWKLAAQLCPKGLEATVYAFMLAGANLAGITSGILTGQIIKLLYINESFDNMWILTIIGAVSPLFSLYFVATVPFEEAIKYAGEHNAAADAVEEEKPERIKKASFLSTETKGHVLVNDH